MIKRLTLTEDHLKLIGFIRFEQEFETNEKGEEVVKKYGKVYIDKVNPYILSGVLDDIALVLGYRDKAIPGTEYEPEGRAYPDEVEKYLLSVHHYIVDNLYDIEVLIHQMVLKGGITPGTYWCIDNEEIWSKED